MSKRVKKIDSYTNEILKIYPNSGVASMLNGDSQSRVINQCKRRGGCELLQQEYYYRYENDEPTPHRIIEVLNLDFEPIAQYISIKEAEIGTSVGRYSISKQLHNPLPIKERKSPSTGLYFTYKEVK